MIPSVANQRVRLRLAHMDSFPLPCPFPLEPAVALYAVAYRPSRQTSGDQIEVWPVPLALGQPLPVLPLALRNAGVVPVDFEMTYREA